MTPEIYAKMVSEWKEFVGWWFLGWNVFTLVAYFIGRFAMSISTFPVAKP